MQKSISFFLFLLLFFAAGALKSQSDTSNNIYSKDAYYIKLAKLDSEIPVFFNNTVRAEILDLLRNQGHKTSELLGKASYAIKNLGPYFDSMGLPPQLALLSVVTSRFNTNYIDPSTGASGIWPLTYSTAKRYRLITNSYVDQRRNMWLSSRAAANYIYDLEQIYQDWHFVISAFSAGPINLNMAIRKAGNTLDYSLVHEALEPNQRQCLEKFFALWYIYNYHNEHKLNVTTFSIPQSDTVCTAVALSLDYVADKLEIKKSIISTLNPDFIEGIVPEIPNCTCFRLPSNQIQTYREMRDSIEVKALSQDSTVHDSIPIITPGTIKTPTGVPINSDVSSEPKIIYYTIKSGDNLGLLSKLFDCTISEIKKWNHLRGNVIYAGTRIKFYVPGDKIAEYKRINSMSASQKQALARRK
ncbi:MAG: transglycosylase SLT domain-containing protein [Bacteroidetes bacterium]|nr:transglycosylase SLT domain-containing protein [Bacteroidota bacterium]